MSKGCILLGGAAMAVLACMPGNAASSGSSQRPQPSRATELPPTRSPVAPDADPASRGGATRARMLECGHQWNNMKRAGTASGTWKDFSRGCLVQR